MADALSLTFFIKQNDTYPPIQELLTDDLGNPIDITGASIEFHMRGPTPALTTKVNAAATIVGDPLNGTVQYQWIAADTDTAGSFLREWQITFADGRILTVPNTEIGYAVTITDDIAD